MFGQCLVGASRLGRGVRYFRSNATLREHTKEILGKANESTTVKTSATKNTEAVLGIPTRKCSNFDKWLLTWMKKFPNKEAVPDKVSVDLLQRAQTQFRVRMANVMIVLTIMGCIWAVVSGKRAAKAGVSVTKQNEEWHKEINRKYRESLAAQPKTT